MAKRKTGGAGGADPSTLANLKYGEARERLETILTEIESAEVDVDDLAERVKEAAALIRVLHDKLTRTKAEVERVVADVQRDEGAEADDDDEDDEAAAAAEDGER